MMHWNNSSHLKKQKKQTNFEIESDKNKHEKATGSNCKLTAELTFALLIHTELSKIIYFKEIRLIKACNLLDIVEKSIR